MPYSDYLGNDIIDTGDLIIELAEFENEHESLVEAIEEAKVNLKEVEDNEDSTVEEKQSARDALERAEDDLEEFKDGDYTTLKEFCKDLENSISDYLHGETLIKESYFTEYAQDLAEDLGYTSRDVHWPYTHIDWEAAAEDLKQDYTSFEVGGYTYYARA